MPFLFNLGFSLPLAVVILFGNGDVAVGGQRYWRPAGKDWSREKFFLFPRGGTMATTGGEGKKW
jgi:hypothetical protein